MCISNSLASKQFSLFNDKITYDLFPPIVSGCRRSCNDHVQYPVSVDYDYEKVDLDIFRRQNRCSGILNWESLLPPLVPSLSMGEGNTPLILARNIASNSGRCLGSLFLKDESRNPTWSHKDRLNLCTVSSALISGSPGIVVASLGNHGASAAAYARRAGMQAVVIIDKTTPEPIERFISSYGAKIVKTTYENRWALLEKIIREDGFYPVSNLTSTPTGHAFGPEGYKTISYEIFQQLNFQIPDFVFVPTGYGELLYGVWRGFWEINYLGISSRMPKTIPCEPATRGPLYQAFYQKKAVAEVVLNPTVAYSIGVTKSSYRGQYVLKQNNSFPLVVTDNEITDAQNLLLSEGLWCEKSAAAGLAGLCQFTGTIDLKKKDLTSVCILTSSGFKDVT